MIDTPIGALGFTNSSVVWRKYKSKQITAKSIKRV